ncbi:HDR099Wp [Eremothecium sinecaudum]|uniref:Large ribosomal subunit protein mL44 n=1 Tax=Eremothecium sinecaudum TaxID=45286 RepID=A0A0X8HSV7_9SACH|nr:HDR099Wp [Eremothecium sinecaudum]AMD20841.1 HDR099Wp [Eremothecium sinecaudum]
MIKTSSHIPKCFLRCFATTTSVRTGTRPMELEKYKQYYRQLQGAITQPEIADLSKSPTLTTLHRRLSLPDNFKLSTLTRCLTCRSSSLPDTAGEKLLYNTNTVQASKLHDNYGLNIFGKNILTYYVTKKLLEKYPRLPTPILNAAVDAYIADPVLYNVGKTWGIEIEESTIMDRNLKQEPINVTLGKLRFYNNVLKHSDGIKVLLDQKMSVSSAMALAVRSIIAGLWASTKDEDKVFKFIDDHIMSRHLDVSKLFQFEQPTRELSTLCRREGLQRPHSKLIAESGRASKAPVYIIGVFSGEEKLGEGFGSSLKEAKARAATDALMKWYCYERPADVNEPVVDPGQVLV